MVAKDISEPKISSTNVLNTLKVISGNAASLGLADGVGKAVKNRSIKSIVGMLLKPLE